MEPKPIQKILVPVDFSPGSRAALDQAAFLARKLGASLELLHVWRPPAYVPAGLLVIVPGSADRASLEQLAETEIAKELKSTITELERDQGVHARLRLGIDAGNPADSIVDLADKGHFDLIVMGTHGRTGVARLLLGSVAERVARLAPCPVLVVPAPRPAAT